MHTSTRTKSTRPDAAPRLWSLLRLLCGGILLQTTTGGCEEYFSNAVSALGYPVATGIGNGLSNLVQALVVGVFI
jgi:hypothetical protein